MFSSVETEVVGLSPIYICCCLHGDLVQRRGR